jgi:hypothetical protein
MGAVVVSRLQKLVATIVLFGVAVVIVVVAGTVHDVGPLFLVWIPLLAVPWLLTRPEPGDPEPTPAEPETEPDTEATGASETDES